MLWAIIVCALIIHLAVVRGLRYRRAKRIIDVFGYPERGLDTMTYGEACSILLQLEQLEFPYSFRKARKLALLKTGSLPSMTKLFAATGQNNTRQAPKRAVDTKVLLLEFQLNDVESERNQLAISRVNFFHDRYRKAGKILDGDLLRTLADSLVETIRAVNEGEWRRLTIVESNALGVYYKALGQDLRIPFTALPSSDGSSFGGSWPSGIFFANELIAWCREYEEQFVAPSKHNLAFADVYTGVELAHVPKSVHPFIKRIVACDLDDHITTALGLPHPGYLLRRSVEAIKFLRRQILRHFAWPRPAWLASIELPVDADPTTGKYNLVVSHGQPWYVKKSRWSARTLLDRALGRKANDQDYDSDGYSLWSIGPTIHESKGREEMELNLSELRSAQRGAQCPFSYRKKTQVSEK